MTAQAGAASGELVVPSEEELRAAEKNVRRFQARIVKAMEEGRPGRAQALQHLLTHSHSGRLVAVYRVTHNQGSKTPGVDGET
jgi:RNA-directed DNA polymerase